MDTTESEAVSLSIDAGKKRRDPPPLNVFLRIRPFIDDELQRGENQKSIDILDDKHIAVKIYPSSNNAIRTIQTSHNEYEVTRVFDHRCTQQELFERILEQPTNEIFTGSNWLLCTLGLTNSGKTHTMFGTGEEPGLIPQCLRRIFLNIGSSVDEQILFKPVGLENFTQTIDCDLSVEIGARNYIFKDEKQRNRLPNIVRQQDHFDDLSVEEERYSIWISFFELYNENILDLLVQPKQMKTRKNLRLLQNDQSTMIKNLIQIPVFDIKEAEEIIKFGYSNRATSKTHLNQASSRSHAIICITLITVNEFDEEPTMSHMYICDLAGNEPSTSVGKQLTETCNINTSLMTFKDCIRILNENQTTKKQMLVPYRNSVLTSIFRPFFVGRGRTIICCNVNPCATFITQTNDLLKFCALAQKTIIVPNEPKVGTGLIRQQRKSKNKGPKRLGKNSLAKEKNISTYHDVEDFDGRSVDESSLTIPTNIKSIIYWKYCTKRALELLQKQASNRRQWMIERHRERVHTVAYLLDQRQQTQTLNDEKQAISNENELLSKNLRLEQDNHRHTQHLYNDLILNESQHRQKLLKLEKESQGKVFQSQEEIDSLRKQLKLLQQQFQCLTDEHLRTTEQIDQDKHEYQEREQQLQDEIQRLKRDFGLELYRKQDAERKARAFEDKVRHDQSQYQKIQYDLTQTKHDLKTLQVKYDALQLEIIEMHQSTKTKSNSIIEMLDGNSSPTTDNEETPARELQNSTSRAKRRTNDESDCEKEIKKTKRVTRSQSTASTDTASTFTQPYGELNGDPKSRGLSRTESTASTTRDVAIPIKQLKKKAPNDKTDSKVKSKPTVTRGRAKKQLVESPPASIPVQQESHSPIYATIQRKTSLDRASFATVAVNSSTTPKAPSNDTPNATPKPSTFKRIQSFFRATPTLSGSARVNRVVQVKTTTVAFGSSTPTNRMPPSIVKTPGPSVSTAQKIATPKSKYNLRTRLFNNPTVKEESQKKTQAKKPSRARK